jgi:hypothetical protein
VVEAEGPFKAPQLALEALAAVAPVVLPQAAQAYKEL